MCKCDKEVEARARYLLPCNLYAFCRATLLNDIYATDSPIKNYSEGNSSV